MIGVPGDHAIDDEVEPIGDVAVEFSGRGEQSFFLGRHQFQCGVALEGEFSGEEVIEATAEGIDIGSEIDGLGISGLFGGHVEWCSHAGAALGHRHIFIGRLGQSEVGDLDQSGSGDQHVVGFDVAVNEFGLMSVEQCFGAVDRNEH